LSTPATTATPSPAPTPSPAATLADAFLSPTFLYQHESRAAFLHLLEQHLRAYAPANPHEELLTFRITQKAWLLRRLDKLDRILADSAVTRVQAQHPNAAPAACIATLLLTTKETAETQFALRTATQRQQHEAALHRLESQLQTLQHRRQDRQDRHARQARENRQDRLHQSLSAPVPDITERLRSAAIPASPATTLPASPTLTTHTRAAG
jgi:uncharacterized protein YceH (UPF0502 family)